MNNFTLITGGARSGKSTLAEKLAKERGEKIVYIATAIPFDEGMKERIRRHRQSRPKEWITIEKFKDLNQINDNEFFKEADLVLVDCITLLITNLLLDSQLDFDNCAMEEVYKAEKRIFNEIDNLLKAVEVNNKKIIAVTNEVGMGLVPVYRLGNIFRDIAGRVNQHLAKQADEVYLTVSGIPLKIK